MINKEKNSQRNLGSIGSINLVNGKVSFTMKHEIIKETITRKPIMIKKPKGLKRKYC